METPRTDELNRELHAKGLLTDRFSDMLEHARELERELNHWKDVATMTTTKSESE